MPCLTRATGLPVPALWFLAGTFASNIGNAMHTLAAGALLYQQTGNIAAFGAVVVVEQAATFLMQVVAGPSVDRGDPRRSAIVAEMARGAAVCALSLLLVATPGNLFTIVLAMTVVIRCLHSFHRAGTFALTPALVPAVDLAKLNSWFSACQQGGQLVGLGATGLVVAHWGTPAAFFINGVTFLVSAAALAAVRSRDGIADRPTTARAEPIWQDVLSGWADFGRFVWRDVRLTGLLVVSTADNITLILFNLILAPLVAERFSAEPAWLSLLASGFAFGAMSASAIAGLIASKLGVRISVLLGIACQMLCFAALWWIVQPHMMLLLACLLGVFNTISWTTSITAVQLEAPAAVRGRLAMARNALTAAIAAPLIPLAAFTSQWISHAAVLLLAGGVCAGFLLLAAASIGLREVSPSGAAAPIKTS